MASITSSPTADDRARLDVTFAALTDERGSVEPISAAEREARCRRLGRLLGAHGVDALLVEPGSTMRYLTGVEWGLSERLFALLVTADGVRRWVTPAFEASRAASVTAEAPGECVAWDEHEHPYAPLASALRAAGCARVAVDPWLRFRFVQGLRDAFGEAAVVLGEPVTTALRGVKDAHEIKLLRRANELTQRAISAVARTLEPGVTSTEIALRLTVAQERLGLTDVWHLALIGPAAAFPHGEERERTLGAGDLLLVDTGGKLHGYCSDNTRSWVVGAAPRPEVVRIWNVVRDAQRAAFDALRPGARACEADRAARRALERAGFSPGYEHFFHRVGHGIGLDGHEDPHLDGGSEAVLEPGMCFSDEPGIYLPGVLGLRIEDIVCVTEDGAEHFGEWQAGPESPEGE